MEEWRPVPGYEGRYEVSNLGRVRSFLFNRHGKVMKLDIVRVGYARVHFQFKKTWLVHRLVAIVFIQNPNNLPCVNHKNGVKTDNRVENLEWSSHSDNMRHSWRDLQSYKNRVQSLKRGEESHSSKLTEADVRQIRKSYATGTFSQRKLAREFGVSKPTIQAIVARRNWAHVA